MASEWVRVSPEENDEENLIEIPTEPDGTLLLDTIKAQFPEVTGLKFKNEETNSYRAVRILNGALYAPQDDEKWGKINYICVRPSLAKSQASTSSLKRKASTSSDHETSEKIAKDVSTPTKDLICLGIPFKTDESEVSDYFEKKFGSLAFFQLKKNNSGQSKGYGFLRFNDLETQVKVLQTRHLIEGRWCDVKIPDSQDPDTKSKGSRNKVFVARLTDAITKEDLKQHFEAFGKVTDVYYPQPFKGYAFVTFFETNVAESLINCNHMLNGVSIYIGNASPKSSNQKGQSRFGHSGLSYERDYQHNQHLSFGSGERGSCFNSYFN